MLDKSYIYTYLVAARKGAAKAPHRCCPTSSLLQRERRGCGLILGWELGWVRHVESLTLGSITGEKCIWLFLIDAEFCDLNSLLAV